MTKPLENALSTLNGVKNVTSQSNENYSLLFLEYQDDTDMDSAMVKASTAVNQLGDALPDMASTPTLMEISPDMMATQYIAVDYDGMDIYELSDYVSENVLPQLERVDGVASVSTTGLVEKSVQITLDQEKIDAVNDKLLVKVSDRLADAKKELDANKKKINDGMKELDAAQAQLDAGKAQLNSQKADVTTQLRDAITELDKQIPELEKKIASLQTDLDEANRKLEDAKNTNTTLPEVTLPIDDALFASCKTVLAAYDPQYNADALPANLAEAKSDLNKMGAMINSIDRADAAIRQRAADEGLLEQNMTVEQTAAYLDAQYAAMSARIQALEVEIASLQDTLNNTEDESERADLQAQIDAKRAEQAQDQAVIRRQRRPPCPRQRAERQSVNALHDEGRPAERHDAADCAAGGRDCAERRYAAAAADAERHRRRPARPADQSAGNADPAERTARQAAKNAGKPWRRGGRPRHG